MKAYIYHFKGAEEPQPNDVAHYWFTLKPEVLFVMGQTASFGEGLFGHCCLCL